jgi:hypothetical protein
VHDPGAHLPTRGDPRGSTLSRTLIKGSNGPAAVPPFVAPPERGYSVQLYAAPHGGQPLPISVRAGEHSRCAGSMTEHAQRPYATAVRQQNGYDC